MPKQVIEPEIVDTNQLETGHEKEQNNRTNSHFYFKSNVGCLGVVFAFISLLLAIPLLIFGISRKKK